MLKNCCATVAAALALAGSFVSAAASTSAYRFSDFPYVVERIPEERLPQNSVVSMVQSKQGYLWLATLNGLVRSDGIQFKVFSEANTPGLIGSGFVCLFEDSRSNLWVGTEKGGIVLIQRDGAVRNLRAETSEARLVSVCEDSNGAIWLNTGDHALVRYADNHLHTINGYFGPVIAETSGGLWLKPWLETNLWMVAPAPGAETIAPKEKAPAGQLEFLLASSRGGYWRLADGRVEKWKNLRVERDLGVNAWGTAPVKAACEDQEGNLIVGTDGAGIWWYDADGRAQRISSTEGLSHDTVLSLCFDREGVLWAGTDSGGLHRVKRKHFRVLDKTQALNVPSVCDDGRGGLWFTNPGWKVLSWKDGARHEYGADE